MTNATNTTIANNLYPVANGVTSSSPFVWEFKARDPTVNDVNYPIQKLWLNTTNDGIWFLKNFVSNQGIVTANWIFVATGGQQFQSLSDTANTVVFPSLSSDTPPNNIQLVGGTGITVTSDPTNHLITFAANGSAIVEQFALQSGTTPVGPLAGIVTFSGASVAAGTNPVRTDGTNANTMVLEVQTTQAIAATDATKIGLAAFNSGQFSVDTNGFVSLAGGGEAIDSVAVQTGTSPIVPNGSGQITINGAVVAAGTNPVRSDGTGANTMALEVQISQALAATDATKIGLANFDSAAFDVDANGFVQLNGGGVAATSFDVQANTAPGTDPVVPTAAGVVTVNGAAVANHSVVLETRSRAANAYNVEVQYATTAASTDATKSGVAHFNSAQFTADANGFVSATGSIPIQFTGNTGTATPAAGNINILAASTAAGTSPASTTASGSTVTVNVQKSQAIASTNANNVGLAAFNSARFSVDANGFVDINGAGVGETITGQSGGSLSPTAGNWNIFGATVAAGTSPLVTAGSGSTLTINAQRSQALAAADSTKVGLSNFDSTSFAVDGNGFVTLAGAGIYISLSPYIVGTDTHSGYSTIAAGIAAAVSGGATDSTPMNVYIKPKADGTAYTENLTLSPGVNLIGFGESVTIIGKISYSSAGTVNIQGLTLQTNSDFFLEVTGSASSAVYVRNCFLKCTNNTGINYTSSVSSSDLRLINCRGNISTTGITYFTSSSTGFTAIVGSYLNNSGLSITPSTCSAGPFTIYQSNATFPFSVSGSGTGNFYNSSVTQATNAVCFTSAGSSGGRIFNCYFASNTESVVSAGAGTTVQIINSTISSILGSGIAITGAGTVSCATIAYTGTASTINTTTQTPAISNNDAIKVVTPGAYPYTTVPQDALILVDTSSARTIVPAGSPVTGQKYIIKDSVGSASTNNITITPSGKNIDGMASRTIASNYGSITIVYNGTEWSIV